MITTRSLITICHCPKLLQFYWLYSVCCMGFPGGISGKELACQCRRHKRRGFNPWVRKIPWSREWQPTLIFLLRKFHGQWSLVGYSPWGLEEWDTTELAHTHTHTHTHNVVHYIPMTYLFNNWNFVSLIPVYLFYLFPPPPVTLVTTSLFSASMTLFYFVCFAF